MRDLRNAPLSRQALVVTGLASGFVALGVGIGLAATTVTRDTTDVRLRVLHSSFADGFDSGWHTHPGLVVVQVSQGKLKVYQGSCEPVVVQAGQHFIETPFVPVRAVGYGQVEWTTTQIIPAADAPLTVVPDPC